ncbi:MAG: RNB domain-containing ribonuclease [Actinomycetota bacterium]|nr:RNB domain-containing ribonuclease [Actinomycetota bacterium]
MRRPRVRFGAAAGARRSDADRAIDALRARLGLPETFASAAMAEASDAARGHGGDDPARRDRRDVPLVTLDPAGSRDLDQAFAIDERPGGGMRLWYAIADVAAFVRPGGALENETLERGVTYYGPDRRTPLHPTILSEGAASLLAGAERPAVLWALDVDGDGELTDIGVERATVRSRAALDYRSTQAAIDDGSASANVARLVELGRRRRELAARRGAVELEVPTQEVVEDPTGRGYVLRYDAQLPVEGWNAQLSLLCGMAAARLQQDAGIGLLRTLPPPSDELVAELRRAAAALGVEWAPEVGYAARVRELDGSVPAEAALLSSAARLFRGAGYVAFTDGAPDGAEHSAIAAPYAHVTAPLRRVADRYATEVALAAAVGSAPPAWAVERLEALPEVMATARQRESELDRATIDIVEALVLAGREGARFEAVVLRSYRDGGALLQLRDPAVIARADEGTWPLGEVVEAVLTTADVGEGEVRFGPVTADG